MSQCHLPVSVIYRIDDGNVSITIQTCIARAKSMAESQIKGEMLSFMPRVGMIRQDSVPQNEKKMLEIVRLLCLHLSRVCPFFPILSLLQGHPSLVSDL